ncbi:MAG: hypothetical protein UU48_C0002G0013 [Candidatus Uhrbacteria bacterium GW2011_GWF2_41_16]|uniref:ATP-grasp domain-containing protein n=2 Tax=Candidatus Uhriibacteriota TaxID=1752732 RepID=A0A0G0VC00_9BACT|nr:MAG: hypothetical protein UU31_C0003G0021 [Candidatus Uhrbacteria bacterium GW2011_GWA2_41_10]KKR87294.1 MAG: hypothetical protein UU35_C0004G0067 [Candidatus Uhrbacteria bacterium GW2011_GWC2_41_11]KKR98478.1 MAG: hypothetical protein UU48_C0002G0013 [Candidatus Uhrbacteria bacterium GW2011_GWF2_41_16]HBO99987.1 hypothetical protein [Candidatus Uhrbacteria bacterium]
MTVYCHVTEDVIDHTPESRRLLGQFSLRALLLAESQDTVILPGRMNLPPEMVLLNTLEIGPEIDRVKFDFSDITGVTIQPFSGTSLRLREMVKKAGCVLNAPNFEVCYRANDKGAFQTVCMPLPEARLPFGVSCRSEEVPHAVQMIHREFGRPARIKASNSASGLKQGIIRPGDPVVLPNGHGEDGVVKIESHYVVQIQYEHDLDASVQFFIHEDGCLDVGPVTRQYVDEGGHHFGNTLLISNWIPDEMQKIMIQAARVIAVQVRDQFKYFGHGSVDFICNRKTGDVYAVEVNARVTAATYPLEAARAWYGTGMVLPFDMRSFWIPYDISLWDFSLSFHQVLFNRKERIGFVPFCFLPHAFPIENRGFCYGVCFARDERELLWVVQKVEECKRKLLEGV